MAPGVGVPPVQDESRMPAIGSQVSEPLDQPVEVDGEQMDINEPKPPNEVSDTNTSEPTGTTGEFDETINIKKTMCEYQASKLAKERVVGIENKLNFMAPLLGAQR